MAGLIRAGRLLALLLVLLAAPVRAQEATPQEVAELARDVDRAESVRAVKNLQRLYAQYAQYGLWGEIGDLFAEDGRFIFDGQVTTGETFGDREAIVAFLRTRYGGGEDRLAKGEVSTMLIETPVVSLAPDGESAKGRWSVIMLLAQDGKARIEGGIFENDYVRRNGRWQIAQAHYYPQYDGAYEDGWTNWGGGDLPIVPYHFTPDSSGVPIPPPEGAAPATRETMAGLTRRITALNAEDEVRSLQAALGYYIDRKMWDDVTDMFAESGQVVVSGRRTGRGKAEIRTWFETAMGPAGLRHGQLNDYPQFDITVSIFPDGRWATVSGIELSMLGEADQEKGWWEVARFYTHFVNEDGVWKVLSLERNVLFRVDYDLGWGDSQLLPPVNTGPPIFMVPSAPFEIHAFSLEDSRRRLLRSTAYDGIENVSSAYGYYLDDFKSASFSGLLATEGFKMSAFAGYYVGRDRVTEAGRRVWGPEPVTRTGISFHWRVQPVILVSEDGRSANQRVRLFQPRTGKEVGAPGGFYGAYFYSGMYHDQYVLEDGIWRMWNLSLDEPYMGTVDWKSGWQRAKDPTTPRTGPTSVLVREDSDFKPDVPVTALGKRQEHFRGGTGEAWQWPTILPMWFEYVNPVSGRVPEFYQEDCPPCVVRPDLRLDHHGYQQPPVWPQVAEEE